MEKHNNIQLVVLYILIVIACIFAVYFGISLKKSEKEVIKLTSENEALNNEISLNRPEKNEFKNAPIDITKCLNSHVDPEYNIYYSLCTDATGLHCGWDSTSATVVFTEEYLGNSDAKGEANKEHKVLNIDKKIVDVQYIGYGQDVTHCILLFLLEDGTVNYLTYNDMANLNNFTSKKFKNVSNVTRILRGSVGFERIDKKFGGGRITPFLINDKGEFYDTYFLLRDNGEWY